MKSQTIIIGLITLILLGYIIWNTVINTTINPDTDTRRASDEQLPKEEKNNDKLVIVNNTNKIEIDSILNGFCNMYNKERFQAQPRVYNISENQFAITFPFDIEFEIYCYFINYVHYPMGFDKSFEVIGWTTTKKGQTWITEQAADKQVMLYIPSDDTEHDNVYLTTNDNIGYKLGFAMGEEKQQMKNPKQEFELPKIKITDLKETDFKDYK